MDLKLSWDLFIIVFFAIIAAYSFIIGRKETVKIIIATYVAVLTSDGVTNVLMQLAGDDGAIGRLANIVGFNDGEAQFFSMMRILIFILIIVLLSIFGDYDVDDTAFFKPMMSIMVLAVLSLLSGGLILSTIIVYANGGSLIDASMPVSEGFKEIYQQSRFVKGLLDWHDVWFSLPGIVFIMLSIVHPSKED